MMGWQALSGTLCICPVTLIVRQPIALTNKYKRDALVSAISLLLVPLSSWITCSDPLRKDALCVHSCWSAHLIESSLQDFYMSEVCFLHFSCNFLRMLDWFNRNVSQNAFASSLLVRSLKPLRLVQTNYILDSSSWTFCLHCISYSYVLQSHSGRADSHATNTLVRLDSNIMTHDALLCIATIYMQNLIKYAWRHCLRSPSRFFCVLPSIGSK
jgi:hypothetical protein